MTKAERTALRIALIAARTALRGAEPAERDARIQDTFEAERELKAKKKGRRR